MADDNEPKVAPRVTGAALANCEAMLVYTTFPDQASAVKVGRALVEQHLAGCINILGEMTALYMWEGQIEQAAECVLIAKTVPTRAEACMSAILAAHPYATPAVLALPVVAGAADYLAWLRAGTTGNG